MNYQPEYERTSTGGMLCALCRQEVKSLTFGSWTGGRCSDCTPFVSGGIMVDPTSYAELRTRAEGAERKLKVAVQSLKWLRESASTSPVEYRAIADKALREIEEK